MSDSRLKFAGIYASSEPEFVGRFPVRPEICVLPSKGAPVQDSLGFIPLQISRLYSCADCGKFMIEGDIHTPEECIVHYVMES